jgi:arylsulfatase A
MYIKFLNYRFIVLIFFNFLCSTLHASNSNILKPNVVIIFTDDQGYADVGKFGAVGFQTPNLDKMAKEGAIFRNFHVPQPICSASRCGLLTGCYPNRLGINGALLPKSKIGISDNEMTLAQILKKQGYATGMLGKWHLGDALQFMPLRHGFDSYFGLPYSTDMWPGENELIKNFSNELAAKKREYPNLPIWENERKFREEISIYDLDHLTTWYTDRAIAFIKQNKNHPFFLYVAHNMPHVPLGVSDKFRNKSKRGLYGDVIEEIDWSVGEILEALKENGIDDNTFVIFASDNGPWLSYGNHAGSAGPLREGKATTWEGGTRVPCIMRWPGKIPAGTDTYDMLMTIDLLPTITNLAGGQLPTNKIDGLDLWPLISRNKNAKNTHTSYWFYYEKNELQAVTTSDGKWKLQFPHSYQTLAGRLGGVDGVPVTYSHAEVNHEELYDLETDIGEKTNLKEKYPQIVKQLELEAEKARLDLGDTLTNRVGSGLRQPGYLRVNK